VKPVLTKPVHNGNLFLTEKSYRPEELHAPVLNETCLQRKKNFCSVGVPS
jgi:hypothetical protein